MQRFLENNFVCQFILDLYINSCGGYESVSYVMICFQAWHNRLAWLLSGLAFFGNPRNVDCRVIGLLWLPIPAMVRYILNFNIDIDDSHQTDKISYPWKQNMKSFGILKFETMMHIHHFGFYTTSYERGPHRKCTRFCCAVCSFVVITCQLLEAIYLPLSNRVTSLALGQS